MLGNLKDKVFRFIVDCRVGDINCTIYRWKLIRWKPEIYDRSNDLYYLPFTSTLLIYLPPFTIPRNASAPPTISIISLVMLSCLLLL